MSPWVLLALAGGGALILPKLLKPTKKRDGGVVEGNVIGGLVGRPAVVPPLPPRAPGLPPRAPGDPPEYGEPIHFARSLIADHPSEPFIVELASINEAMDVKGSLSIHAWKKPKRHTLEPWGKWIKRKMKSTDAAAAGVSSQFTGICLSVSFDGDADNGGQIPITNVSDNRAGHTHCMAAVSDDLPRMTVERDGSTRTLLLFVPTKQHIIKINVSGQVRAVS